MLYHDALRLSSPGPRTRAKLLEWVQTGALQRVDGLRQVEQLRVVELLSKIWYTVFCFACFALDLGVMVPASCHDDELNFTFACPPQSNILQSCVLNMDHH